MHALGGRTDILGMGGLRRRLPITHAVFLVFCLAISGIPPFAGFFSKDEILAAALVADPNPAVWAWPAWAGPALYAALFAAALGTAFYMWRLYFLVFAGPCRADEETRHHIHESPASMTAPLIVLALGAAGAGALGLPHAFGLPNTFGHLLARFGAPVPMSAGLTATLMAAATLAGLAGIAVAAVLYARGPERGARVAAALGPVARFVEKKLYVDELYDLVIVRPLRFLAAILSSFVDRVLIDLILVRGSALVVQRYLAVMIIGVAGIVFFATRPHADFRVAGAGAERVFQAEVDTGPAGEEARFEWDVDGDGRPEAELDGLKQVDWRYAAPGRYTVRLWVTDGVFGRRAEARHVVVVRPEEVRE
jgi:NADH-quinone oxidoreductase subunit L